MHFAPPVKLDVHLRIDQGDIPRKKLTDTLVMAISEESGRLILARNGQFLRSMKLWQVEQKILQYLHNDESENWEQVPQEQEDDEADVQAVKASWDNWLITSRLFWDCLRIL